MSLSASTNRPSGYDARPDYRVELLRRPNRIVARLGDIILADSDRAIIVDEQDHDLVVYFPREDVAMQHLAAFEPESSYCPFKGDAGYFTLASDRDDLIAWTYNEPYHEVAAITGHIAFYQNKVDVRLGTRRR